MAQHLEEERERGGGPALEWEHGVCGGAGEQRPRARTAEAGTGEAGRRAQAGVHEARGGERMPRHAQRAEQVGQVLPVPDGRAQQAAVGLGIAPESGCGLRDGAVEGDGRPVVERVRERDLGVREGEAVGGQRQRAQEGGRQRERVDRRAHVVPESRQRQLGRPRPAADRLRRLQHAHRAAGLCERDRGGQAVRAGADHDGVAGFRHGAHRLSHDARARAGCRRSRPAAARKAPMPARRSDVGAGRARSRSSPAARRSGRSARSSGPGARRSRRAPGRSWGGRGGGWA